MLTCKANHGPRFRGFSPPCLYTLALGHLITQHPQYSTTLSKQWMMVNGIIRSRFLHKVNMAVRGPIEIINKDEASPCEIRQKIATKKPIIFIQRWFMFPFPLFTLPDRIKTKISRFVCGLLIIFSFLCCIHWTSN